MHLADFEFNLPPKLIAQFPLPKRSNSRLLCLSKETGAITHNIFKDLPNLITPKDLLVFNNTKVIPARLFATKPTGGKAEILVERILENNKLLAQIKTSKPLKIGAKLVLTNDTWFEVTDRQDDFFELVLHAPHLLNVILKQFGQIPLPPYIEHKPTTTDNDRYQTIYAKYDGAVAAPTAGLHFDEELMQNLARKEIKTAFLTLHVGAGTFQPIRTKKIEEHKMHKEHIDVPETICKQIINTQKNGGKIIAVGTTSARALETACLAGTIKSYRGDTNIFIYPGYKFRCIDGLITNFHLPKTSLLLLVCALAGHKNIMHAYQKAIHERYRFFSYGDGMLII
ncbi:MAG: tRNA preQ1(34) S-adenosylmethionine ribosyltransferase-isomerase QueA [bacterium]